MLTSADALTRGIKRGKAEIGSGVGARFALIAILGFMSGANRKLYELDLL